MSGGAEGRGAVLHEAVLDATAVTAGTRLLDLGCGAGGLARRAAGRGARVTGVDTDPDAVAQAAAAVPGGTFLVRHAQDPPPGPFDVVTAVQLLGHVSDPVAVLHRAGRAGGVVAATVWGRDRECDLRVLQEALATRRPGRGPAVNEPARLRAMAERAGLAVELLDEVVVPFDYADAAELIGPLLATPVGRSAARRTQPDDLRDAVLEHLAPYRTGDGGYRLHNLFRVLVARTA
ncbi:methyltransferase domain-containing protein [Blastococcus sp. KM273128]|uniref:methyltransferase domain-containing protein n=1 Tax=Blastococcus sp. KM273128 TaxID=2570314 RepID=UPI001F3392EF|nr:methyltransferase domain-containing protein [Blastococcus sp. KM273128]